MLDGTVDNGRPGEEQAVPTELVLGLQRWNLIILILFWAVIYIGNAGYPPALLDDADTVHAEAARETAESGDWITLHANGIRYLEKAPLMYWSVALSYKIFGVNEFTSRLPIALATLFLVLITARLGAFAFGATAGFYSGLAIASCIGIFLFTRVLWPDVMLTGLITFAFYCFLRSREDPAANARYVYGIYAAGALGVLTKGLIGAAFPGIIIAAYLLVTAEIRNLLRYRLFTGTLFFLLIAAPWHLAAGFANPGSMMEGTPSPVQGRGFFWFYFMNEHFLRYIGERYPRDYDTVPLWLFLLLHLVWLFPWSFFLPMAIRDFPRRIRNLDREAATTLFLWLWAPLVILFFSFSTTQEYYTMPAYPAFAILIGKALARTESAAVGGGRSRRLVIGLQTSLAVVGSGVFVTGTVLYLKTRSMVVTGDIASTLTRNPEAYALSLGHVLDLTPQTLALLQPPVIGTALAFGLGTIGALLFRLRDKHELSNLALAVMMTGFFLCARASLAMFEPYLSSRTLAEAISREYKEGDKIVINGEYEGGSSINFYTRRQVYILNGRSANLQYGSFFRDAPRIFLGDEDLASLWSQEGRIFLFTDALQLDRLSQVISNPHVFAESAGKLVLSNQQSQVQ